MSNIYMLAVSVSALPPPPINRGKVSPMTVPVAVAFGSRLSCVDPPQFRVSLLGFSLSAELGPVEQLRTAGCGSLSFVCGGNLEALSAFVFVAFSLPFKAG